MSPKAKLHVYDVKHFARRPTPRFSFAHLFIAVSVLGTYFIYTHLSFGNTEQNIPTPSGTFNPAYLIKARHGAVATENRRCSDIGVEIMRKGGNAVDSAIAATFCIGVVHSFSSGIGGGGFMVVRVPNALPGVPAEVTSLNFRETSPGLSNSSMYVEHPSKSTLGGLAVGTPGEVKGLYEAWVRWGKLPWQDLVYPSATLAQGWTVDVELARRLLQYEALILNIPEWKIIFAPEGRVLNHGETIRLTNLSNTLLEIAQQGPRAFYSGPIAASIVKTVQKAGGILTLEDLSEYKVTASPALIGTYRGRKIYTTDAPSCGAPLLHMLNIAEQYQFEDRDGLAVHRLVEALKYGFASRSKIGDIPYLNSSDVETILHIPSKSFAVEIVANLTDDATHPPEYYNPLFDVPVNHGTSHVSAADESGMAVALTSSVNSDFGAFVMDPATGIMLNNEQGDFSVPEAPNIFGLRPSPLNYPEPGKQPLSSMSPLLVDNNDGTFFGAFGGSGGSRIFGSVFQVLLNVVEWGMDVSAAIEYARVHDQLYPLGVTVEDTLPTGAIHGLLDRGHNVTIADINCGTAAVNAVIHHKSGIFHAASDSRKNGIASGY
ncbi:nucleophile aminohydrolase [Flagelloscypha sp. PMI_526]|nr:nucleophile aminohydrolase [Flagelloscypha sp. PMI_526]